MSLSLPDRFRSPAEQPGWAAVAEPDSFEGRRGTEGYCSLTGQGGFHKSLPKV